MLRVEKPAFACVISLLLWAGAAAEQHASVGTGASPARGVTVGAPSDQAASKPSAPVGRDILVRAIQLHQAGDFDEAIREYRRYLALDPGNFVALANLGAALAHQGRYTEAIAEYKGALKIRPGNPQVALNLALAHYKALQLDEAVRELVPLQTADPANLQISLLLGDCYFRLGEDKKTVKLLEPLEAAQQRQRAVDYLLGMALIRSGQVAKGEVLVNKILRDGDSPEAHLMLGEARLAINDTPGAINELTRALKLDPKVPLAHWLYGKALLESGHRAEAIQAFREELAIDPNEFDPNVYVGALLNESQEYKQAMPYLDRALEVRPGSPQVRYQIAIAQIGMGNLVPARKTLDTLVKDAPNFREAHISLASVDYRLHRKQDGNRERAIVAKLNAEYQARQKARAAKASYDGTAALPGAKAQDTSPEAPSPHKPGAPPAGF